MPASKIAVFGATGDCAGHCLAHLLTAGFHCIALARTPAKLTRSMKDKGVSGENIDAYLTVVQGNVKDIEAVKQALQLNGQTVDTILSGIGGAPALQWSLMRPVALTDPRICYDAGSTILQALTELKPVLKPLYIHISTAGIPPAGMPRDVPLLLVPLYHWLIAAPIDDKAALEKKLAEHMQLPERERGIRGSVGVKASLLMNGESLGIKKIREGVDEHPAIGYTIHRADVGLWIFEKLLKTDVKDKWLNKNVSITY